MTAVRRPNPSDDLLREGFRHMVVDCWGGLMMVEELTDPRLPPWLLGVVLSRALMIDFLMVKRLTESGGFVVNLS